jgi:hypothetical protein
MNATLEQVDDYMPDLLAALGVVRENRDALFAVLQAGKPTQ